MFYLDEFWIVIILILLNICGGMVVWGDVWCFMVCGWDFVCVVIVMC